MTTSLEKLTRLAAEARTTDELVRNLLAALQGISGLESIFLARVNRAGDHFELSYTHNAASGRYPIREGTAIAWSESVCKHALQEGVPVTHTSRDRWPHLDVIEDLHITTYTIEPIRDETGEVIGTLCAISDRRKPVTAITRQAMKLIALLVAPRMGGSVTATAAGDMDRLTAQSVRDNMTGLPARSALAAEVATALEEGARVCLLMVDLVGFGDIDTQDGHWAADQFLYAVSQRLVGATAGEPGAFIARFGDREFAVMLRLPMVTESEGASETKAVGAMRERLVAATRGRYEVAWTLMNYDGAKVTTVIAESGEDVLTLLGRAEDTMRAAASDTG